MTKTNFNFNVTGTERKRLVKAISEHLNAESKYCGAPSFAYTVSYVTIDRNGTLSFDAGADNSEIEALLEALTAAGFFPEATETPDQPTEPHGYHLTVTIPADSLSETAMTNLNDIIASKGHLIRKALGVDKLPIEIGEDFVSFPWFPGELSTVEVKAYTHLVSAICEMARNQKRITAKEKETDNDKYAFRCFLLRLGFIGTQFKDERKVLLRKLTGSSAFKSGAKKEVIA